MHIKKNDVVMVITGKDKGKKGRVLKAMPKTEKIIVEGVNMQTKHQKQTRTVKAEIKHIEGPIHVSNAMYFDKKSNAPTRIGYKMIGNEKVRISRKTGAELD